MAQLVVRGLAWALALDAHDDGLAWVRIQKAADLVDEVAEVLVARDRDGEDTVHKDEAVLGRVCGGFGLDADVEEAHAVVELVARRDGLAAHGGKRFVAGGTVVGAGNAECGDGRVVVHFAHPVVEVCRAVDAEE